MKNLFEYLIGKHTKNEIDVDDLDNKKTVLYDSTADEDMSYYEDFKEEINEIEKNYSYFICTKFKSLGKSKSIRGGYDPNNDLYMINEYDLELIVNTIINGKDLGYEVRLQGGHIEIDCINSGARSTYYIYSLSHEAFDRLSAWWEGDNDVENIRFLYNEGVVIPIKL